MFKLAFAI